MASVRQNPAHKRAAPLIAALAAALASSPAWAAPNDASPAAAAPRAAASAPKSTAPSPSDVGGSKPSPAPVSSDPSLTSASFGDWVVRCQKDPAAQARSCEAAISLVIKGQNAPIAQIAFASDKAQSVIVVLPTNIAFDKPPELGLAEGAATTMAWRRCLPVGCFASATFDAARLKEFRDAKVDGRLSFTDAAEQTLSLPFSLRGLAQALDDLSKEAASR